MKNEYPKWLYASGGRSCIVNSFEEHLKKNIGKEWHESPSAVPASSEAPAAPAAAADAAPASVPVVAPAVPPALAAAVSEAEAKLTKFYTMPAKLVVDQIYKMESLADLMDVRKTEENRPGGARVTVLRAVLARMESFQPVTVVEEGQEAAVVAAPKVEEPIEG